MNTMMAEGQYWGTLTYQGTSDWSCSERSFNSGLNGKGGTALCGPAAADSQFWLDQQDEICARNEWRSALQCLAAEIM